MASKVTIGAEGNVSNVENYEDKPIERKKTEKKRAFIDENTGIISYKDYDDTNLKDGYIGKVDPNTGERGRTNIRLASPDEVNEYKIKSQRPQPIMNASLNGQDLDNLRNQQAIDSLNAQYASQYGALDREQATIKPQYEAREQEQIIQKQRTDKAFSDWLAEKGSSGLASQGKMASDIGLGSSLAQLGRQEAATMQDLESRRSTLAQQQAYDTRATQAGLQAEAIARADAQRQQDFQNQLALSGLTGMYNGQQTLQGQSLANQLQQQEFSNQMALRQEELQRQGMTADEAYRQAQLEMQQVTQGLQNQLLQGQVNMLPYEQQLMMQKLNPTTSGGYPVGGGYQMTPYMPNSDADNIQKYQQLLSALPQKQAIENGRPVGIDMSNEEKNQYIAQNYNELVSMYGKDNVDRLTAEVNQGYTPGQREFSIVFDDVMSNNIPLEQKDDYILDNWDKISSQLTEEGATQLLQSVYEAMANQPQEETVSPYDSIEQFLRTELGGDPKAVIKYMNDNKQNLLQNLTLQEYNKLLELYRSQKGATGIFN